MLVFIRQLSCHLPALNISVTLQNIAISVPVYFSTNISEKLNMYSVQMVYLFSVVVDKCIHCTSFVHSHSAGCEV